MFVATEEMRPIFGQSLNNINKIKTATKRSPLNSIIKTCLRQEIINFVAICSNGYRGHTQEANRSIIIIDIWIIG